MRPAWNVWSWIRLDRLVQRLPHRPGNLRITVTSQFQAMVNAMPFNRSTEVPNYDQSHCEVAGVPGFVQLPTRIGCRRALPTRFRSDEPAARPAHLGCGWSSTRTRIAMVRRILRRIATAPLAVPTASEAVPTPTMTTFATSMTSATRKGPGKAESGVAPTATATARSDAPDPGSDLTADACDQEPTRGWVDANNNGCRDYRQLRPDPDLDWTQVFVSRAGASSGTACRSRGLPSRRYPHRRASKSAAAAGGPAGRPQAGGPRWRSGVQGACRKEVVARRARQPARDVGSCHWHGDHVQGPAQRQEGGHRQGVCIDPRSQRLRPCRQVQTLR